MHVMNKEMTPSSKQEWTDIATPTFFNNFHLHHIITLKLLYAMPDLPGKNAVYEFVLENNIDVLIITETLLC